MNENLINQLSERLNWAPEKTSEALDIAMLLMNEELPENTQISIPVKSENITSVVSYVKKTSKDYVSDIILPLQWSRSKISEVLRAAIEMMNGKMSEEMEMFVPVKNEDATLPLRFEKKTNKDFQAEVTHLMESTQAKITDAIDSAVTSMHEKFSEELEIFVPTTYRVVQQIPANDQVTNQELVIRLQRHPNPFQVEEKPEFERIIEINEEHQINQHADNNVPSQVETRLEDVEVSVSELKKEKLATEDVIAELSQPFNWEHSKTSNILDTVVDIINEKLSENAQIFIPNFGVFQTQKKTEHISVDRDTQQRYLIPPKIVATFKSASGA